MKLRGDKAIRLARSHKSTLCKDADASGSEATGLSPDEAMRHDPQSIWIPVKRVGYMIGGCFGLDGEGSGPIYEPDYGPPANNLEE